MDLRDSVQTVVPKMENEPESITQADASYLSSAETRATGRREKGGTAARAQSLADQNKNPPSNNTSGQSLRDVEARFQDATERVVPKMENEPGTVTQADASYMSSAETMATGGRAKGGVAAQAESLADQNKNPSASKNAYGQSRGNQGLRFQAATDRVVPKMEMEPEAITQADASYLSSAETKATGRRERGGLAAQAESLADQNKSPTSFNNTYRQSLPGQGGQFQEGSNGVVRKMENEPEHINQADASNLSSAETRATGRREKGGIAAQAESLADRNKNAGNV